MVLGILVSVGIYGLLALFPSSVVTDMLRERGAIPYIIVFFTCWSAAILFLKSRKLRLQRAALSYSVVPDDNDFVLSSATADTITKHMYEIVDDPKFFVLYNRISIAIANLRNLGRVTDVDEMLRSQAEQDASVIETSYSLIRGFIWAIPVLGFVGTVLGLSDAIGGFGGVLATTSEVNDITDSLKEVTGGLAIAFDTTLVALIAALCLQIALTFLHKAEEEFLDNCAEYCHTNIVSRLRIMPYEEN